MFRDTGFIILKENKILLVSAQFGGRTETYELKDYHDGQLTFDSVVISNDPKSIRSQRVLRLSATGLSYELNMNTRQADTFQNHLKADLKKVGEPVHSL